MPLARVLASISARSRPDANQTPSTVRIRFAPAQSWAMARNAPVGSASPNRVTKGDAEECSNRNRRCMSARKAGTVNASGVVVAESR